MGFFSWKTSDTKESIYNKHTDKCKPVYLYYPDGTIIKELEYDGYGRFNGKDTFTLLAQWNKGDNHLSGNPEFDRSVGIEMYKKNQVGIKFPLKFSFSPDKSYDELDAAEDCPYGGYFTEDTRFTNG